MKLLVFFGLALLVTPSAFAGTRCDDAPQVTINPGDVYFYNSTQGVCEKVTAGESILYDRGAQVEIITCQNANPQQSNSDLAGKAAPSIKVVALNSGDSTVANSAQAKNPTEFICPAAHQ